MDWGVSQEVDVPEACGVSADLICDLHMRGKVPASEVDLADSTVAVPVADTGFNMAFDKNVT